MKKTLPALATAALVVTLSASAATAAPKPEPVPYTPAREIVTATGQIEASLGGRILSVTATCPTGKVAVGGGHSWPQGVPLLVTTSAPVGEGWQVEVMTLSNGYGPLTTVTAHAVCVNP